MKKQLLLAVAFVATVFGVNAQTTWNFSEIYNTEESLATVTSKGGVIVIDNASKVKIEDNTKYSEGVIFTRRLKLGGKATLDTDQMPKGCSFGVPVTGAGTFKFVVLTGTNADLTRTIDYTADTNAGKTAGTTGLTAGVIETEKVTIEGSEYDNIKPLTWEYTGNAGTVYFYSLINGNNYYAVTFTPEGGSSLSTSTAEKAIIATEYYNVAGIKMAEAQKGLNIVKNIYEDGSVAVSKTYIK